MFKEIPSRQISRRSLLIGLGGAAVLPFVGCGFENGDKSKTASGVVQGTADKSLTTASPTVFGSAKDAVISQAGKIPETAQNSERARINLGNWQIQITGWEQTDLKREVDGAAALVVQAVAKNVGSVPMDRDKSLKTYFRFAAINRSGEYESSGYVYEYLDWGGRVNEPYAFDDLFKKKIVSLDEFGNVWQGNKALMIPPGFSFPIGILFYVKDYKQISGIAVYPNMQGLPNPYGLNGRLGEKADLNKIPRIGDTVTKYDLVDTSVKLMNYGEPLIVHNSGGNFEVRYGGNKVQTRRAAGGRTEQVLGFILTNNGNRVVSRLDLEAIAFLKGGLAIGAEYLDEVRVPAGQVSNFSVVIGADRPATDFPGLTDNKLYKIYDLVDGVVTVAAGQVWGAWKI